MDNILSLNNNAYSNNNDILFNIVKNLESIVIDLNNNKQIDIIINQIKNIIIIMNNVIRDNKKNIDLIRKDINNMIYKFEKIENNIPNNNSNIINKTINYKNDDRY